MLLSYPEAKFRRPGCGLLCLESPGRPPTGALLWGDTMNFTLIRADYDKQTERASH